MSFFRYDSDVMLALGRVVDLVWLSILCFVCSIPIVTSGAAVSAKYYTSIKLERGEAPGVTRAFFHSFKENLKQDTKITLILILIYAFFATDWYLVLKTDSAMNSVLIGMLGIFSAMVAVITFCIFPLMSRFEMKTFDAFRNSLVFGIVHLPRVILGIFMAIIPYFISIWYYKWAWLIWLFVQCVALYYNTRFFGKHFDKLEEKTYGTVKRPAEVVNDDAEFSMNFDEYDEAHNIKVNEETGEVENIENITQEDSEEE
ncbi:MAG: YesL family protein [Eubacterium sp.]|nr:YesL family protein [Eubacterium sp.]